MEKIPNEIDELLWAAAESGDASVESEFAERYPHLRTHLATRKAMIDVLRNAKPTSIAARSFRPPHTVSVRWWLAPAAAAVLASLAFGAYQVTKAMAPRTAPPLQATPIDTPGIVDSRDMANKEPSGVATPPGGSTRQGDVGTAPRPQPPTSNTPNVRLRAGQIGLIEALEQVRLQSKLRLELMPGIKDLRIELKANLPDGNLELSPLEWLRMLEQIAPIHVVDGGPDGFLVLPLDKVKNVEPGTSAPVAKSAKPGN